MNGPVFNDSYTKKHPFGGGHFWGVELAGWGMLLGTIFGRLVGLASWLAARLAGRRLLA